MIQSGYHRVKLDENRKQNRALEPRIMERKLIIV